MDQAVGLRKKGNGEIKMDSAVSTAISALQKPVRVMAVSSGKGGVGKSNVVINLVAGLGSPGAPSADNGRRPGTGQYRRPARAHSKVQHESCAERAKTARGGACRWSGQCEDHAGQLGGAGTHQAHGRSEAAFSRTARRAWKPISMSCS